MGLFSKKKEVVVHKFDTSNRPEYRLIGQTRFSKWLREARINGAATLSFSKRAVKAELSIMAKIAGEKYIPIKGTRLEEILECGGPVSLKEIEVALVSYADGYDFDMGKVGQEFQCTECYGIFPIHFSINRGGTLKCKRCMVDIYDNEDEARMRKNKGLYF